VGPAQFPFCQKIDLKEEHIYIKFCFRLAQTGAEICEVMKLTFREETVKLKTFSWFFQVQVLSDIR
jgi:hypothetical protein